MRAGQIAAADAAPNPLDGYPKGSTVLCQRCFVPLFVLERAIAPAQTVKDTGRYYAPVTPAQLEQLRRDVPSITAALRQWTARDVDEHCRRIEQPKNGSRAECPACHQSWVQVFAPDAGEVTDRAYTWRLVTVPPLSAPFPVRSSHVDLGR